MRWASLSVVFLAGLLAGAPHVRADGATADRLLEHLMNSDIQGFVRALDEDTVARLGKDPDEAGRVLDAVGDNLGVLTQYVDGPEGLRALAARAEALGRGGLAGAPGLRASKRAHAKGIATGARLRRLAGDPVTAAPFEEASGICVGLARELPSDAAMLLPEAALILSEALPEGHKDLWSFSQRAWALIEEALGAPSRLDAPGIGENLMKHRMVVAERHLSALAAAKKKGDAKKLVASLLDELETPARAAPKGGNLEAARFNLLVSVNRREGLGDKRDFCMQPRTTLGGKLTAEIPNTPEWKMEGGTGKQALATLICMRLGRGSAQLAFFAYPSGVEIRTAEASVPSENLEGVAKMLRDSAVAGMAGNPTLDKTGLKGKLNGRLPKTCGFEAEGKQSEGRVEYWRAWVWKGEEQKQTFVLQFRGAGLQRRPDPEIERVLESLREVAR